MGGVFLRQGQLFRFRRNLVKTQSGNGRQMLRRVRRVLPGGNGFLAAADSGSFFGAPAGLDGTETGCFLGLALLPDGVGGQHQDPAMMGILQNESLQQRLKITRPAFFPQAVKECPDAEICRRAAAVEPALQYLSVKHNPLGRLAVVPLPGFKFQVVQHREDPPVVQSFPGQSLQLLPEGGGHLVRLVFGNIPGFQREPGLLDAAANFQPDVPGKAAFQKAPLQRGLVVPAEDVR